MKINEHYMEGFYYSKTLEDYTLEGLMKLIKSFLSSLNGMIEIHGGQPCEECGVIFVGATPSDIKSNKTRRLMFENFNNRTGLLVIYIDPEWVGDDKTASMIDIKEAVINLLKEETKNE